MTTQSISISLREKFQQVEQTMLKLFLEREDMVKYSMLCLATQSNMVVIGERGTAKTKFFQTLSELIKFDDVSMKKFFEVGLNAYSIPDEIFGPLDISALKRGEYKRVVENFAPNSMISFLDEIFKAKDQTLNSFLKFVLEKKYFVNGQECSAKTKWFFAASNEFGGKDKLGPFEDRFQVWLPAFYLEEDRNFLSLMKANVNGFPTYQKEIITVDELESIKQEIDNVVISEETLKGLLDIRKKFFENNIRVSDRTFCRLLPLIKYSAWYDGRTETNTDDLEIIWVSCWEHNPDMKSEISKTKGLIQSVIGQERENLLSIQDKVEAFISTAGNDPDLLSTVKKIAEIKSEVEKRKIKKSNEETRKSVLRSINNVIVLLSDMATRRKK